MENNLNVVSMSLTAYSAKIIINNTLKQSERVFFTTHAEERMIKRMITRTQIFRCLEHGKIIEGPYRDTHGNWKMNIEVISAGDRVVTVCVLDKNNHGDFILIITTF